MGGFVLDKILGNTFPHPHKIFNQQKPNGNLKEKKKNMPRYKETNYNCLVLVVPNKVKRKLFTAYLPEELSQTIIEGSF